MANRIATILGMLFLLVGLVGFVMPAPFGAHFTPAHNIVHLVTGAISLWLGLKGTPSAAKTFCIVFGLVYLLLGVCGFLAGSGADKMLTLLPDQLMFGTTDHIIHVVLGAIYLIGGLATKTGGTRP
jgi:hypothetical protein